MNVLTKIRLINELNDKELRMKVANTKSSWHQQYRDSAWVYVGNMPFELSEGDVICVMSQYGEIVNINLIRDQKTGKSKGFAFVCYEDQRSTILAVDNLNGTKIKQRQLRVDHVLSYKVPKEHDDMDALTSIIHERGVAPGTSHDPEVKKEVEEVIVLSDEEELVTPKAAKKEYKKKHKHEKEEISRKKKKHKHRYSSDEERRSRKHSKKSKYK